MTDIEFQDLIDMFECVAIILSIQCVSCLTEEVLDASLFREFLVTFSTVDMPIFIFVFTIRTNLHPNPP